MRKLVWLSALFLGLMCAALWRGAVLAQDGIWEMCLQAGQKAQQQGRPAEAARLYQVALRRAERFDPRDPRRVTSLIALADLYRAQGDAANAAPLYQRALALGEQALGPDNPVLAACRQNYEALRRTEERKAAPAKADNRAAVTPGKTGGKRLLE